jgi:plastocyanin
VRRPLKSVPLRGKAATTFDVSLLTLLASIACLAALYLGLRGQGHFFEKARPLTISGNPSSKDLFPSRSTVDLASHRGSVVTRGPGLLRLLGSGLNSSFTWNFIHWPKSPEPAAPVAPSGVVKGKIKYEGILPKAKRVDMSKEPNCAKQYDTPPMTENVLAGANNALANVVVYISAGLPAEAPAGHVSLNQRGCRYFPHVLALQAKQEIWVKNDDDVNHTVHLMTKTNAELNRLQPANAPEFSITNDKPEFIRVKCELHPWMRGVIAVLMNSHFAVTNADGSFKLPDLPPGKYTITVWHESFGTESKEIVLGGGETKDLDFVFKVKPD